MAKLNILFIANCLVLGYIGQSPLEAPFLFLGQLSTALYFVYFILCPIVNYLDTLFLVGSKSSFKSFNRVAVLVLLLYPFTFKINSHSNIDIIYQCCTFSFISHNDFSKISFTKLRHILSIYVTVYCLFLYQILCILWYIIFVSNPMLSYFTKDRNALAALQLISLGIKNVFYYSSKEKFYRKEVIVLLNKLRRSRLCAFQFVGRGSLGGFYGGMSQPPHGKAWQILAWTVFRVSSVAMFNYRNYRVDNQRNQYYAALLTARDEQIVASHATKNNQTTANDAIREQNEIKIYEIKLKPDNESPFWSKRINRNRLMLKNNKKWYI